MSGLALNRKFLNRSWRLFGIVSKQWRSRANLIFLCIVFLAAILQVVVYYVGLIPSRYFTVLGSAENHHQFPQLVAYSIMLIVLNSVMKSLLTYMGRLLYLTWRHNLTVCFHHLYFGNLNYYKLNVRNNKIDNCDQRLTRDIDQFCQLWTKIVGTLVVLPFTIGYYSYQCFHTTTWLGPVTVYLYFLVGAVINRQLMAPVVRYNVEQEVREGDFRYQHVLVRNSAESMAFFRASRLERVKSNRLLTRLLSTLHRLYNWNLLLSVSVNTFDYMGSILSYLVIAVPILAGDYSHLKPEQLSAVISQNSFVCMYLIYQFSQVIDLSSTLTDIAAHTHRLGEMYEVISVEVDDDKEAEDGAGETPQTASTSDGEGGGEEDFVKVDLLTAQQPFTSESFPAFYEDISGARSRSENAADVFEREVLFTTNNLTFSVPSNAEDEHEEEERPLVSGLSVCVRSRGDVIRGGGDVLVTGGTGCGKTSLLRVMAGLWGLDGGAVATPLQFGAGGVVYLPQTAVLTQGTLLDQVIYPLSEPYAQLSAEENLRLIEEAVDLVGLRSCVSKNGGLDGKFELNWKNVLSPGEIQRLCFARLFYHQPRLAVLDEPTSSVSVEMEDKLFAICKQKSITCLTVAHGNNLRKHHSFELHFKGNGGEWEWKQMASPPDYSSISAPKQD